MVELAVFGRPQPKAGTQSIGQQGVGDRDVDLGFDPNLWRPKP